MAAEKPVLIEVRNLKKYFPITRGVFRRHVGDVKAVDDITFKIYKGETLGLVGETGCGKTTVGRTLIQLYPATAGQVIFDGTELTSMRQEARRQVWGPVRWVRPVVLAGLALLGGLITFLWRLIVLATWLANLTHTAGRAIGQIAGGQALGRVVTPPGKDLGSLLGAALQHMGIDLSTTIEVLLAGALVLFLLGWGVQRVRENVLFDRAMQHVRRRMQMIFQDPYASLNPRMTVGGILSEPLQVHRVARGPEKRQRVEELLKIVGFSPYFVNRYPHEFSGGQRQRIGIARALALNPDLIICDEPISSLDVSIQAQVVNLLEELQGKMGLTYLFIAHDLSMVRHISDRIAVMYLGKIVELADRDEIYLHPLHPYTQALMSAVPVPDPEIEEQRQRIILQGDLPSPANPPKGCNFNTRCPVAKDICHTTEPEFREVKPGHFVACYLVQ